MCGYSCSLQAIIAFLLAALLLVLGIMGVSMPAGDLPLPVCTVATDRLDVPVRVGPGVARAVRLFLPAGDAFLVIGQAIADDGSLWWRLFLADVDQAWVDQADVMATGACHLVPFVGAPPVVPAPSGNEPAPEATEEATEEPGGDGTWGECGSCPDCGPYDPAECILAPDGQCLWDPANCGYHGAPDDGNVAAPPVLIQPTPSPSPVF